MSPHINSLVHFFQLIEKNQWHQFGKVLIRESKSGENQLIKLWKILNENNRDIKLSKEDIYAHLFEGQPYKDNVYRQLTYKFRKKYDAFLLQKVEEKPIEKNIRLANYYKNNEKGIYQKVIKKIKNELENEPSIMNFRAAYYLESEKMEDIQSLNDRTKEPNLQSTNNILDKIYLLEKFKLVCSAINYSNINSYSYDFGILKPLEPYLPHLIDKEDGILYAMFKVFLLLKHREEKDYKELHEFIYHNQISNKEELEMIFLMMTNYCIRKINSGDLVYFKELFELYKLQIAKESIYNQDGMISPHTAKNIIAVSLRLKEFKWTKLFIESIAEKINLKIKEETIHYLYARLEYENQNYNAALRHLATTVPIDFMNNLAFRVLQSKCLYEIGEFEILENNLENFRLYLLRHKSNTSAYALNINFMKFLKRILKVQKSNQNALFDKINNENKVTEKVWLLSLLKNKI